MNRIIRIAAVAFAVLLISWSMLGFPKVQTAAAQGPGLGNSIEQRQEMIRQLVEIKELLRQQNELLRQLKPANASTTRP